MDIKNKKILVTGGAGFIGSYTVNALVNAGADVVIVDNLSTGRKENINPKATFYNLNIADEKIKDIFEKERPEVVYHFAFNVLVPKSVEDPLIDLDSIAGSINVLKNSKSFGIKKIIFASSGFIYGNTINLPTKENEPIDPVSPYVVAKNAVENYIKFFNKAYNLPCVILRYATVYGSGQVMGAMSDYIKTLASGGQSDIWGDGTKTRDYVYVDDVVNANILALDVSDNFKDPVFNVGTGVETTLNQAYSKIAEYLGKISKPNYHEDREGELMRFCLSNSKIKDAVGWEPKYKLEDGLLERLKKEGLL
jgi:UDP-glucose 4-epimerase